MRHVRPIADSSMRRRTLPWTRLTNRPDLWRALLPALHAAHSLSQLDKSEPADRSRQFARKFLISRSRLRLAIQSIIEATPLFLLFIRLRLLELLGLLANLLLRKLRCFVYCAIDVRVTGPESAIAVCPLERRGPGVRAA